MSVLSSATNSEGTSVAPMVLVVIAPIAALVFVIMATIRLWKIQKAAPILLISSGLILLVYSVAHTAIIVVNILRIINFIALVWTELLLWAMPGRAKKLLTDSEFTPNEVSLIQEALRKGNHKSAEQRIAFAQQRQREKYKEVTGVDPKDIIPEIGQDISWADIVNHVFRVIEFDRSGTTILQNNQVKAKSWFKPYGYLVVESPILNQEARLPIIHRDDFLLAASVFDEPAASDLIVDHELLVTYAPKHLLPDGLSGSPHHVLHYVLTPRGTLDSYYSMNNGCTYGKTRPSKIVWPICV